MLGLSVVAFLVLIDVDFEMLNVGSIATRAVETGLHGAGWERVGIHVMPEMPVRRPFPDAVAVPNHRHHVMQHGPKASTRP